jgi:hypothetical protein
MRTARSQAGILAEETLMSRMRRLALFLVWVPTILGQAQIPSDQPGAKTWVGRNQEIEEYLKTAECVTIRWFAPNNAAQCTLRPGGPVARMAWRMRPPGIYRGFKESYKTEIAAYELDKLLKMDMVPPTVARQVEGTKGAAQQWVENVVDATDPAIPPGESRGHWENQLVRMTMFDNLIGNRDRNKRNMLRDNAWGLILIDHSRAFGAEPSLYQKKSAIDEAYWARIELLTRAQLDGALQPWLDPQEVNAILERREKMRAEIKSRPK